MTLIDLLRRAIVDATDLERMYRLDAPPPPPRAYEGLAPEDLITSPVQAYAQGMDSFVLYTPTWTSAERWPELKNGSLNGWLAEDRSWAAIRLVFGSDTDPGAGAWRFTCPISDLAMIGTTIARRVGKEIRLWVGYATVVDEVLSVALSTTERGAADERLSWATSGEVWIPVGAGIPFEWQAGDVLQVAAGAVPADFSWQQFSVATDTVR